MFKFFKKTSEQEIIRAIPNEIDTAADRLLNEAKEIINNTTTSDKAKRLTAIGFVNSEVVKEYESKEAALNANKEMARLIQYYQFYYPFQKFITEEELNRICSKYGLIYAPIKHYLKDVPEKNLTEIENVPQLKPADRIDKKYKIRYDGSFKTKPTKDQLKLYREGIYVYFIDTFRESTTFEKQTGLKLHDYTGVDWSKESIDVSWLFIAAPKSHFNLEALNKTSSHGFHKTTITKDPIVFRYCRGGIQVLTKWGLEASDEGLVNAKTN